MKYTGYNPSFIEEMPSRIWKKILREEIGDAARHTPFKDIERLLRIPDYNDVLKLIFKAVGEADSITNAEYIRDFANKFSVLYALETSFEFVIDVDKHDKISDAPADDLKAFHMPFEGMVINFKKGNLYSSSFVSCIELTEKYHRGEEVHKVYVVKESAVKRIDNKWRYGVVNEYTFIPVLAPRVFINCILAKQGCPNFVATGVESHITIWDSVPPPLKIEERLCIKSPRTIENCPPNRPHANNKYIYPMLSIVMDVVNIVKKRRTVNKVVKERIQAIQNENGTATRHEGNLRFIDLTKPIQRYTGGIPTGIHHGNHKSPKQHLRHEHTRHLKSGKEVFIHDIIVNKGNKERVTYKV